MLALAWPDAHGTLLDARQRSTATLETSVAALGLTDRIQVVCGRAEDLARDPAHREQYDLVTARSFGPPPVTAECAVGFLSPTGRLAVTEPPESDPTRWSTAGLEKLGLGPVRAHLGFVTISRTAAPIADWPRKRPHRTPLW